MRPELEAEVALLSIHIVVGPVVSRTLERYDQAVSVVAELEVVEFR